MSTQQMSNLVKAEVFLGMPKRCAGWIAELRQIWIGSSFQQGLNCFIIATKDCIQQRSHAYVVSIIDCASASYRRPYALNVGRQHCVEDG